MSADIVYADNSKSSSSPNLLRAGLGCLFMLPAVICCIATLFVPTIQTVNNSLQSINGLSRSTPQYIGLDNYTKGFQDPVFTKALGFTLLIALGRVLAVGIVPPILALALNQLGRAIRVPVRLLYSLPLALFAPVSLALSWRLALNSQFGLFAPTTLLQNPNSAPLGIIGIDALTTFGIACGVGLIVFLIALRGTDDSSPEFRRVSGPLLITWVAMVFTAIALALQTFVLPDLMTQGGPATATTNLGFYLYRQSFLNFRLGPGSAISTVMLLPIVILGVILTLIVIVSRLRLQTVDPGKASNLGGNSGKTVGGIVLALGMLGSGAICAFSAYPQVWTWMGSLLNQKEFYSFPRTFNAPSFDNFTTIFNTSPIGVTLLNTIVPVLIGVLLIQLPVSYFGALGIGGLRPFGDRSEWTLLLFSPWLLVTIMPLSIAHFLFRADAKLINTLAGMIPPILVSVPTLFILTLFFKGKEEQWRRKEQTAGSFFSSVILPSLPLALLLAGVAFGAAIQDYFWPLLVTSSPQLSPITVLAGRITGQFVTNGGIVAAAAVLGVLPSFVISFVILAVFQIFYLDRLALGTGDMKEPASVDKPQPLDEPKFVKEVAQTPPFQTSE